MRLTVEGPWHPESRRRRINRNKNVDEEEELTPSPTTEEMPLAPPEYKTVSSALHKSSAPATPLEAQKKLHWVSPTFLPFFLVIPFTLAFFVLKDFSILAALHANGKVLANTTASLARAIPSDIDRITLEDFFAGE